ncbi:hypothetical protein P389DRAFT_197055 [Cystobasidium minutum MCA 4210]|uniref:uncharacterized protein n=1 Tax=Cystobasidium minutum MCA 4210 TaxID=1397322 RepID=UPI0034CEEA3B|eukprot:jgi/Rhomi1/197055/gm1.5269_g
MLGLQHMPYEILGRILELAQVEIKVTPLKDELPSFVASWYVNGLTWTPSMLARMCRLSKSFAAAASRLLYDTICIGTFRKKEFAWPVLKILQLRSQSQLRYTRSGDRSSASKVDMEPNSQNPALASVIGGL